MTSKISDPSEQRKWAGISEEQRKVVSYMQDLHSEHRPFILMVQFDGKNYRIYEAKQLGFIAK